MGYYNRENKSEGEVEKFLDEIKSISSDPIKDHFFNVSDELVLVNLTDTLGQKIFALEGKTQKDVLHSLNIYIINLYCTYT